MHMYIYNGKYVIYLVSKCILVMFIYTWMGINNKSIYANHVGNNVLYLYTYMLLMNILTCGHLKCFCGHRCIYQLAACS